MVAAMVGGGDDGDGGGGGGAMEVHNPGRLRIEDRSRDLEVQV